jgi:hypothetical protein
MVYANKMYSRDENTLKYLRKQRYLCNRQRQAKNIKKKYLKIMRVVDFCYCRDKMTLQ